MKARSRILGIGSPFGDDRLGWAAADALRASAWYRLHAGTVEIESLDRPGLALLDAMQGASHVVLVDAMRSGAPPGTIRYLDPDQIASSCDALHSIHGFGVTEALALGKTLGLLPPRLTLIAVEANCAHAGDDLSGEVRAALPALVACVQARAAA